MDWVVERFETRVEENWAKMSSFRSVERHTEKIVSPNIESGKLFRFCGGKMLNHELFAFHSQLCTTLYLSTAGLIQSRPILQLLDASSSPTTWMKGMACYHASAQLKAMLIIQSLISGVGKEMQLKVAGQQNLRAGFGHPWYVRKSLNKIQKNEKNIFNLLL